MFSRNFFRAVVYLIILMDSLSVAIAHNRIVTLVGGDVHLRGQLSEESCVVSSESQDMQVDMGLYRNNIFKEVGSESSVHIPFTIHLSDCNPDIAKRLGINFQGVTDPKEPDVFLVTPGDGSPVGLSGNNGFSGLGLVIANMEGVPVLPNTVYRISYRTDSRDTFIPFTAYYRATSRMVYPGSLRSEVWFQISYL